MEYKSLPDLKHMATLRAVVEYGGVAEAGKALHIGQPAVTKRLRALDACFGINLMERQGRQLTLTAAGKLVYQYSRLTLDHHISLLDDLASLHEGHNKLRLETTFAIGEHLLPDLLFKYADTYPEYIIDSRMGYSRRIQTRLATGLADIALLEQAPEHPDILVQRWLDDEIIMVCGPTHPMYKTQAIETTELKKLKFVMREPSSSLRLSLDQELNKLGINQLPITMEVGSTESIIKMLQRGKHISFLPHFAVSEDIKNGFLHHIHIHGLQIQRTLWIARTKESINNKVADTFVQILQNR